MRYLRGLNLTRYHWRILFSGLTNQSIKLVVLSLLVGVVSGLASVVFMFGLDYSGSFLQGHLMQVAHPQPAGEQILSFFSEQGPRLGFLAVEGEGPRWWMILLVTVLGGLASGFLVFKLAPEAQGHGIDAMIHSFHQNKGRMRKRVPFVKMFASILTLGSGGSGGREGPIALIGGGFGSWLADRFGLHDNGRRHLLLAGAAGGIGSIFRAPLGGAISAIEILYKEDLETDAMVPAVVSSVTAFSVFLLVTGPLLGLDEHFVFRVPRLEFHPAHLLPCLILALACAMLGKSYVWLFHWIRNTCFGRLPIPLVLKPAVGGLVIGLIALIMPQTLGMGMGYIQEALSFDITSTDLGHTAKFCLVLLTLKMLTVSVTIGSGGSGGVFGPSLLIGGLAGFLVGCAFHQFGPQYFPWLPLPSIGAFVILGMSAFFAAVANAPLGALVMSSEMTMGYELLAPLMLVSIVAIVLTHKSSIYLSQVQDKFKSPAHLADISFDILQDIRLSSIFRPLKVRTIDNNATLSDLRDVISDDRYTFPLVVKSADGQLSGMLAMGSLREAMFDQELSKLLIAKDISTPIVTCALEDDLHSVLVKFSKHGYGRLPVVETPDSQAVLGYVQYQEIMEAYQRELKRLRSIE